MQTAAVAMSVRKRSFAPRMNANKKLQLLQKETAKVADFPEISIPGIQNLYKSTSKTRKFMWFVALCFCIFIAFFQIADRINYFINKSIAVRMSVDQNTKLDFPAITFCPPMDYRRSFKIWNLTLQYQKEFHELPTHIFGLLRHPNITINDVWESITLNRSGFLIKSLNETITNNFTYEYWPSLYGTCVTVRKNDSFATFLLPEVLFELTKTDWFLPNNQEMTNGTHIFPAVHHFVPAYKVILNDGPLTLYDVGVLGHRVIGFGRLILQYNVIKYSYINTKISPCTEDVDIFRKCRSECLNDILKQHIRCRLPYHTMTDLPLCQDTEGSFFSNETTYQILGDFTWDKCPCPRLCAGLSFSSSHSINWMYSSKTSFVHILFQFQDATIDVISEYVSYTLVSLLCDMGAILGVMLGICILTFIQIIEVVCHFICNKFKGRNKVTTTGNTRKVTRVMAISN